MKEPPGGQTTFCRLCSMQRHSALPNQRRDGRRTHLLADCSIVLLALIFLSFCSKTAGIRMMPGGAFYPPSAAQTFLSPRSFLHTPGNRTSTIHNAYATQTGPLYDLRSLQNIETKFSEHGTNGTSSSTAGRGLIARLWNTVRGVESSPNPPVPAPDEDGLSLCAFPTSPHKLVTDASEISENTVTSQSVKEIVRKAVPDDGREMEATVDRRKCAAGGEKVALSSVVSAVRSLFSVNPVSAASIRVSSSRSAEPSTASPSLSTPTAHTSTPTGTPIGTATAIPTATATATVMATVIATTNVPSKGALSLASRVGPSVAGMKTSVAFAAAGGAGSSAVSATTTATASASATTTATAAVTVSDQLSYYQTMTAGAVSRTMAQTLMHPAITYKTLLQIKHIPPAVQNPASSGGAVGSAAGMSGVAGRAGKVGKSAQRAARSAASAIRNSQLSHPKLTLERLLRGVDAQFLMSIPHGAFHFFVIDQVKIQLSKILPKKLDFLGDFSASAVSTVICSVVSTPQMVITDRLMAGVYPSFPDALRTIFKSEGFGGFYTGWWPALAQKIPSYGLTWMFFQQLKRSYELHASQKASSETNFVLGALAAAASVTVMIPMDTVKTRLVTQVKGSPRAYKGVSDCFVRMLREEGLGSFYRALPPRLISVVPMMAIQFGVYEGVKKKFVKQNFQQRIARARAAAAAAASSSPVTLP